MPLRAKIHGYTGWINMRLFPYNHKLNNIVMDILKGTNMKYLVESLTGRNWDKIASFDNLTKEQIQTRMQWILNELKKYKVVADDIKLDTRMFAIRSADHIFELFRRLVAHDIWFIWDRMGYLSNVNENILLEVPFTWIPAAPPAQPDKKKSLKKDISVLSGFAMIQPSKTTLEDLSETSQFLTDYEKFPGFEVMKNYALKNVSIKENPEPTQCIIEIIKIQLQAVPEGKRINFTSINQLCDTRVLCGLINSFVPNLFLTEIFLNDKWGLNLVLRTLDRMMMANSTIDSEDLTEADSDSITAFMCYLFMVLFKYRQCRVVVARYKKLEKCVKYAERDLEGQLATEARYNLENKLEEYLNELKTLRDKFDVEHFIKWVDHVLTIKRKVQNEIIAKFRLKFDWFAVPEDISINNLCINQAINLSLTNGNAFYQLVTKEMISKDRKIILRDMKNAGKIIEDFTHKTCSSKILLHEVQVFKLHDLSFLDEYDVFEKPKESARKILGLANIDPIEIDPKKYQRYQIFVEALTKNKQLLKDQLFMYQVFPASIMFYHKILIRACQENELDTVQRLHEFFSHFYPNFINIRERQTLNTASHYAALNGFFEILLFLLENHAKVDTQNEMGNTPLFSATDGHNRECAKLLIEFGASMNLTNRFKQNVLEHCTGDEFRKFLSDYYEQLSGIVPKIVNGDRSTVEMAYRAFCSGSLPLCTNRTRFINGSTFLHTTCYFDMFDLTEKLLKPTAYFHSPFNPNIRDYKGATPLHRCKSLKIIKLLIDYEADVNAVDLEGNCPLHVKCFGERGKHSELDAIELLLNYGSDLVARNKKSFMPIHCAAMQGRIDVIEKLLDYDHEYLIEKNLESEPKPSSPVYLALCNDFLECGSWLVNRGYSFKDKEADTILYKVLTEQLTFKDSASVMSFLCKNGANLNFKYPGGNSALHYAATMSGEPKSVKLLLSLGSNINAVNDDLNTPLFMAVLANNPKSVATLVEYGADVRHKNSEGLTAFDLISDLDEWLKYENIFDEDTLARLKAYNFKHTRDLIRAISEKVKNNFNSTNALMEREQTVMKYMSNSSMLFGNFSGVHKKVMKFSYNF